MLAAMRLARIAAPGLAAALLGWSCSSPPPVTEEKPKRRSFEESAEWQAPAAATPAGYEEQARAIRKKWEQVKQTEDEAERQRLANEALSETRALAEAPPP